MDNVDAATRSAVMAKVRSRGNRSTESRLRAYLVRTGVSGWILHSSKVLGCPDFIFRDPRVAVFVDGCFWHGCPDCLRLPKSNAEYWRRKVSGNQARDRAVTTQLRQQGWRVLRFWEHDVKARPLKVLRKILRCV